MKSINATILKEMYISGANNLYNHYPEVDQLNVFPVPDGDTGMNMNLTVTSGMKEIQNKESNDLYVVANNFSRGLLMGARGNSGVITSQIFKGFSLACEGKNSLTAEDLAECFLKAKEVAYKAVMKPVEGTILTVIREASTALDEYVNEKTTIEQAMSYFLKQAKISLQHTPDLLPVLAEVGVVDSGGAGLVRIIEGMVSAVKGDVITRNNGTGEVSQEPIQNDIPLYAGALLTEDEEGYGYCTQFIIRLADSVEAKRPFSEKTFKRFLTTHGKSVVVVRDDDIVKVHVHTLTPGNMLNYGQQFGEFVSITIENMSEEHHNIENGQIATDMAGNIERNKAKRQEASANKENADKEDGDEDRIDKKYALIAVSSGEGLNEIFRELGVEHIVSGGQTMNPSTEDFVKAIKASHAENVFVFPNNSNISMSASQACEIMEGSPIHARMVPTKTIPQGITACMQFNPDLEPDELFDEMQSSLKTIRSGSVTYAIKDTDIDGVHITKGYYLAMKDKNIVSCVKDKKEALLDLIGSLIRKTSSIITVITGEDVDEAGREDINNALMEIYGDDVEIDVKDGGQPVYSYLVGVE